MCRAGRPGVDLLGAAWRGQLVTLVLGVNVALEGLASLGLTFSARRVEARGDDPAWSALLNEIERDVRRHTRLASPALRALGGGALPREVMGEVCEARRRDARGVGSGLALWGVDPVAFFNAARRAPRDAARALGLAARSGPDPGIPGSALLHCPSTAGARM
ncbi:hypothetical protein WMF11_30870 [Sorangium sp. So ce295]|uniref:hypothetical protein n=1 Tax=Sorangium sp. So ce295 TaxID=3133295 RepID=UPI003F60C85F